MGASITRPPSVRGGGAQPRGGHGARRTAPPILVRSDATRAPARRYEGDDMAYDYELLRVRVDDGVAWGEVDNPPINIMTVPLMLELARFAEEVAADDAAR